MKHLKYRLDIDGLRAIAVLSVVLYHFNKDWVPGGFIGVDIFFVISGFLITGIIFKTLQDDSFSFQEFYLRRFRRILPATTFVVVCTLVFGWLVMLPDDLLDLTYSSVASIFMAANVYFWLFLDTSYFAASSEFEPLLHMWSLGVEEQFYLLWPAIIFFAFRIDGKRGIILSAVGLTLISFALSAWSVKEYPAFAYYMLPTRAGELLFGALTFLALSNSRIDLGRQFSVVASVVGAGLLVISLMTITRDIGFPGIASLLPTIATALLIFGGAFAGNPVSFALSLGPVRFIGKISFSLYLWHWPVLAFYRYAYGELGLWSGLICAAVIVLGTLVSYYLIETPFRRPEKLKRASVMVGGASLASLSLGALIYASEGMVDPVSPSGYQTALSGLEEATISAPRFPYVCQRPDFRRELMDDPKCVIGPEGAKPDTLIFGDSNASHYVGYFKAIADELKVPMRNIAHSACPPLLENSGFYAKRNRQTCSAFNEAMMAEVKKYKTVIVAASWTAYRKDGFYQEVEKTIKYLSDNAESVIVALKIPVIPSFDRFCEYKALKIPFMDCMNAAMTENDGDYEVNEFIVNLAQKIDNVNTISVRDMLCQGKVCSGYLEGVPVYYDSGHLSMRGSEKLGRLAIEQGQGLHLYRKADG
ncbi:acyltransferase family protein [Marinobacter sp. F4206]|uniref:acyltransferase family protein n=1 Tax=Marinobacter sp. F4206 TaxID=2861777 RepID=UPI001C5E5C7E|nr:acyltransferase family protein [Marinobacter sp. F4206]MBW4933784.1 acyltransferase [Marinobacter sp. F4206]